MWDLIVSTLYLFLPAYAANMAPVLATRWKMFPVLARPLDGDLRLGNASLFGPHKTIRGCLFGIVAGIVVAGIQDVMAARSMFWEDLSLFPFGEQSALWWGAVLGGGALGGDLLKSFLKRRLGIAPGARWFPWDQLDMIVGALVAGSLMIDFSFPVVITALLLTPMIGLIVNIGAYFLKVKEAW